MKKLLFFSLIFIVALCACNRKAFVNKLSGTWKLSKYVNANHDMTKSYMDTTHAQYQLNITSDERYSVSWISYTFFADTIILFDTVGHDTVTGNYTIDTSVIRHVDTTIVPALATGAWVLLNSEEDLQLTPDSDQNNAVQYQILKLTSNNLNLLKGNEEFDLSK